MYRLFAVDRNHQLPHLLRAVVGCQLHGPVVPKAEVFNISVIYISSGDIYIYAVTANIPRLVSTKRNVTLLSSTPNCSYTVNAVKAAGYQLK